MKRLFNYDVPNVIPIILLAFTIALATVLQGCAQVGLQSPQNNEDRLQYGRAGVTAAYRTLGDNVAARTITKGDAIAYFARIESVEEKLNLGESLLKGGKPTDAVQAIDLAIAALTKIRSELAAKQKGT